MTHFRRPLLAAAALLSLGAPLTAQPDLRGTIPVFEETFDGPLNRYDGTSGLWSTFGINNRLMTNAAEAVFLDYGLLGKEVDDLLPPLHVVTDDGLSLRTVQLPDEILPTVRSYMEKTGQAQMAHKIRFGTSRISTQETWAQTYGYFEIEARIPRGKGRWPAFWLVYAGPGWPPEIDVFEAYGAGIDGPTNKDHTFNTAVFFDELDGNRDATHNTDITNPYARNEADKQPKVRTRGNRKIYNFKQLNDARKDLGADIYDDFHTYAAMWTPEHVIFYFGKTRETLKEIFRTPTPDDVKEPMFVIANDQFTARGGWWGARESELKDGLTPENDFRIRRITVRALEPSLQLAMAEGQSPADDRDSVITDTAGDDTIVVGEGFDLVRLSDGADLVRIASGHHSKMIAGFGPDDRVELSRFRFKGNADVMDRLTQVGDDVWLSSGRYPWPQTIVFRDRKVADLRTDQFILK
jgi:hypothetical protein